MYAQRLKPLNPEPEYEHKVCVKVMLRLKKPYINRVLSITFEHMPICSVLSHNKNDSLQTI